MLMTRHPNILQRNKTALLIIDVQERLFRVMEERETVSHAIQTLIKGCRILDIPIFYTEQYPQGLGRTDPEILTLLQSEKVIEKMRFSSCCETDLMQGLKSKGIEQIVLVGIECHVCVLQTALDLTELGYQVHVVRQAITSRNKSDRDIALQRMQANGITITGVESVLFELTEISGTDTFKEIIKLIK